MNKKLVIGLASLTFLAFGQTTWAKPDNANQQSVKKCPNEYLKDPSAIFLSKNKPHTYFWVGDDPIDPADDVFSICDKNDGNCETIQGPFPDGLIIIGSNGSDQIEGTPGVDVICGMNGNDEIDGREGNDFIYGNNGNDSLFGNLGDDTLFGGNGNDFLSGYRDDAFDNFEPDTDATVLLTPEDSDKDTLFGGNGNDDLLGGPDVDELYGENGTDHVDGGDNTDIIDGGKGKDKCFDDDNLGEDDCAATEADDSHGKKPKGNDDD